LQQNSAAGAAWQPLRDWSAFFTEILTKQQFDHLEARIKNAESELRDKIEPYKDIVAALDEIPGIDEILAMGIIAEATTDMSNFPNERNFAAWAGVAAGNNESAGKKKDQNVEKATRTSENC
jgi:transposase